MPSSDFTVYPHFWRATRLFPEKEIVSRGGDGQGTHRYTYEAFGERVHALANALSELGVERGSRVGTFGWNHHRHFEAYFAVPLMGAQLHTTNVLLPDDHVEYILNDAGDDVLFVDPGEPFRTIERLWDRLDTIDGIVVMGEERPETALPCVSVYDAVLEEHDEAFPWPQLPGDHPAGMCYTSGTTGRPKGVEYTHEMIYAHSLMAIAPVTFDVDESDVVMPVVPMFHVNGWELPYAASVTGAKQVYPGPSPEPADLARLIEEEAVTFTAGVPTVWINLLEHLERADADLSSLERILTGGSAVPESVMRRYDEEYDVTIEHAWGMTETMSVGSYSRPKSHMRSASAEERYAIRQKQGLLSPGLVMKVTDDDGSEVPWDGESFGELYVRGPTVVDEYYNQPEANEEDFEDGWLKTGDVVTVDEDGYIEIVDRAKDVIKSGGEWISSIELENELMKHDSVVEAVVVGVSNDRWQERPLACVVRRSDADVDAEELRDFLGRTYPRWWLPDEVVFVDEVPKTATGKFDKKVVRDRYEDAELRWTPGG
ncbi:long-chain fatty acid--CoA ligase [Halomarina halobia]|uniref:Long-chain fatty acid--CoA ligase n=1 Tax=Halomarina halobia TaxID=3033386 RepID=A0ABD6AFM8_9EURY|nr:long-chain fatty acid--CoA ligase [Halomarina sp. PSR21]